MLTMDDIVREGHPALREVATEVTFPLSDEEKKLGREMLEFLINSQDEELAEKYGLRGGVGIAAPQLAVTKRFLAIHVHDEKIVFIVMCFIIQKFVAILYSKLVFLVVKVVFLLTEKFQGMWSEVNV